MKRNSSVARSAITAGLGLTLAFAGICAPPTPARAETGTVTITQQHNADATYDAYQLFKADISDTDGATHVSWASDEMKSVVLAFCDDNGYQDWLTVHHPGDGQHDLAQCAAEYLASMIADSPTDEGAATTPRTTEGRSFATRLAREVAAKSPASKKTARTGEPFADEEGYWLFVTSDETSADSGEAGTAPIWVPLGGSTTAINEKSSAPSVDKEVWEDSTSTWGKVADAHIDQDVSYRLTASLPANYEAFDTYHLRFDDTLSKGLELSLAEGEELADVLDIRIDGQEVSLSDGEVTATYQEGRLSVDFTDLKSDHWADLVIGHGSSITVEYPAHITNEANIGEEGNANDVSLTYTDDPVSRGEGAINPGPPTKTFAYQLKLLKVDGQTQEPLAGAGFTIQVADTNSDEASRSLFVQADGSLGLEAATFTTAADGTITVAGIDEGTYLIRETSAPEGYEALGGDIELTISSSLDGTALKLSSLSAQVADGGAAAAGDLAVDTATGTIQLDVTNGKWLLMPLTGQNGIGTSGMAASCVILAAGGLLWVRRHQDFSSHHSR